MWRYIPAPVLDRLSKSITLLMLLGLLAVGPYTLLSGQTYKIRSVFINEIPSSDKFLLMQDSALWRDEIQSWIDHRKAQSDLLAGLDSIVFSQEDVKVYLFQGKPIGQEWIIHPSSSGFDSIMASDGSVTEEKIVLHGENELEALIRQYATKGYPFAQVFLDTLYLLKDTLRLHWQMYSGELCHFSEAEQSPPNLIKAPIFERISGIRQGALFSIDKLVEANKALKQYSFLEQEAEAAVFFLGNICHPRFYLRKSKASAFDFLLGFSQKPSGIEKRFQLTGTANVQLINTLRLAEEFQLKYDNLQDQSPRFSLEADFPYIPGIPFGGGIQLSLFRFQESYFQFINRWTLNYLLRTNQRLRISLQWQSSALLNPDTTHLINTGRLPDILDFNNTTVGLQFESSNLDYKRNPTRGFQMAFGIYYGSKNYPVNLRFLDYEDGSGNVQGQYDSLNLNRNQAEIHFLASYFKPIAKRHVLHFKFKSQGFLFAENLLNNERYLLGGMQNLRGFDEEFLRTSFYSMFTTEYRLLLARESYLSLFNDFAMVQQDSSGVEKWNAYNGSGLGLQLQTTAGNFALYFALGSSREQALDWSRGKIHFGYNTLF